MVHVGYRNLLDLKHIVRVEDGLKVFSVKELTLELIKTIVVRVLFAELLALGGLKHLEDGSFGVGRLIIQNVGHQFL